MDSVISASIEQGITYINFELPGSIGLSAGTYDAYIVGVKDPENGSITKNT